jgi:hypothetical protein
LCDKITWSSSSDTCDTERVEMETRTRSRAALMAVAVVALLLVLVPEASSAERFVVGDAAQWTWGYNYTDWVVRKGPFFLNDSLGMLV